MKNSLKLDEEEVKILQDFERGELTSINNFKEAKASIRRGCTQFPSEGQANQHSDLVPRFGNSSEKSGKGGDALPNPHLKHTAQIRDGEIEKRGVTPDRRYRAFRPEG